MKNKNVRRVAFIVSILFSSFGVVVHAQPIVPPHMGPGLSNVVIAILIGFFIGGALFAIILKIGNAIERVLRKRMLLGWILIARWGSFGVGLLIWAAFIVFSLWFFGAL
ncbi:MAG: hypothetical protein GQ536_01810 [Candidatus Aminicenantes bacterium]|nr:hypothetical protein [Candidatus Aminicenantes bacterium]